MVKKKRLGKGLDALFQSYDSFNMDDLGTEDSLNDFVVWKSVYM